MAALDSVPEMRGVLALFEGVATGAADGYARMAGSPAATLLHLGPGLGNGLANLHNARKARTPVVNIVGDHATYHKQYDAQLESDIETVARNVRPAGCAGPRARPRSAADAAEAVAAAQGPPGQVATLVLPADVSWSPGGVAAGPLPARRPRPTPTRSTRWPRPCARASPAGCSWAAAALREAGLVAASRVANATGATLLAETFPARLERGAGHPRRRPPRLPGRVRGATSSTGCATWCWSTPRRRSASSPTRARPATWCPTAARCTCSPRRATRTPRRAGGPGRGAGRPADGAPASRRPGPTCPPASSPPRRWPRPSAALCPRAPSCRTRATRRACSPPASPPAPRRHDWLCLTGGAIGQGMPVATGAAVACPDRQVINLQADGSALYTIQSLWTQAREGLDVVTIVSQQPVVRRCSTWSSTAWAPRPAGPRAKDLLDLSGPTWTSWRWPRAWACPPPGPPPAEELADQLGRALAKQGPSLVEALVPSLM